MMEDLKNEINEIKKRNKRVEADKAWETSWTRRIIILLLTYIVISIFFYFFLIPKPLLNAVIPTIAFIISTLTITIVKNWWLNKFYK
jgi:hypothetical protein